MKRIGMACLLAACALAFTACTSRNNALTGTPVTSPVTQSTDAPENASTLPEGTDELMPDVSMAPVISGSAAKPGVTSVSAARRAVEQLEDELERLSEVTDAQVMVVGNTAAVALRFENQYGGGVDERIRKMVEERVKGVVDGVSHVFVTEDNALFDTLNELGERLETAADLTEIRQELDRLVGADRPNA